MDVRTDAEFDAEVAAGLVLVDFWATWCGPCRMMGEVIEREVMPAIPALKVVKVNVDEAPELAARFGVLSIPTLLCYRDGVKRADFVGVTSPAEIRTALGV